MNGVQGNPKCESAQNASPPTGIERKRAEKRLCSVDGCTNNHLAKGYCKKHYLQFYRHGKLVPEKERIYGRTACSVPQCGMKHVAKGYCIKHLSQINIYGKILHRTKFDPNEMWIIDDVCYIQMYDSKNREKCVAIIDSEDFYKVKEYKWSHSKNDKITSSLAGHLSRFILGIEDKHTIVDHKNHNRLDNRKINLRKCSKSQNAANMIVRCDSHTGYKGVSWNKSIRKWSVYICANQNTMFLGLFDDILEAAKRYNNAAQELFGEFAFLNNVGE